MHYDDIIDKHEKKIALYRHDQFQKMPKGTSVSLLGSEERPEALNYCQ